MEGPATALGDARSLEVGEAESSRNADRWQQPDLEVFGSGHGLCEEWVAPEQEESVLRGAGGHARRDVYQVRESTTDRAHRAVEQNPERLARPLLAHTAGIGSVSLQPEQRAMAKTRARIW